MASILTLISLLTVAGLWWLLRQGITSKPWLEQGPAVDWAPSLSPGPSKEKIGLGVFMAVASSLFALFISAYAMRMQMPDWRPLPVPNLLWVNTGILILSSLALHRAGRTVSNPDINILRVDLLAAAVTALAFISGQVLAWQQLMAEGYWLASNSANAFFYVLTGLHGLHLLGGLAVMSFVIERSWRSSILSERERQTVRLCAAYWDFLLVVWLILLGVLTGWAGEFIDICRQILF